MGLMVQGLGRLGTCVTAAVYLKQAAADTVMWQMLQKPSVNWSFTHAFVPVCTNRLPGTLLLVAGSDFFVSQTRFLQSAKTTQNTVDDSWKDGCYWHNQNADALPNTSVKQNPSWLGFENIILKQSSTWETHLFGTDVYNSSPLECKQSSPSNTVKSLSWAVEHTTALPRFHRSKHYWNTSLHTKTEKSLISY